jgi:hypothetical protein
VGGTFAAAHQPVTAAQPVQLTVRAGFDGLGKLTGWIPVDVELRNDGPDIEGELQISVVEVSPSRSPYARTPTVYTTPIVLPRRSHKRLQAEVDLRSTGQKMFARLVENGNVVVEQEVPMARVSAGDMLCAVLSRSGPAFDGLASIELPTPLRRARIAHVEVSDIPTRPQVLGSLDCMIFENIATGSMLQSQRDAIATWVNSGGLLVVIGGPTWQRTMAAFGPDLLPVRVNGLTSLDSLDGLNEFGRIPITVPGPWLISQATVTDGTVYAEQDGVPLVVGVRRGSGNVIYMAADPSQEPLRSWSGNASLWRSVLAHGGSGTVSTPSVAGTFASWGRVPRTALIDVSSISNPSIGWMWWFVILFSAAVGPANFLALRALGRPGWALVTTPLIALGGAFVAFNAAATIRDGDVILNKVSMVRVAGNAQPHSRTYVSVVTRRQGDYQIKADPNALISGMFYPFPRDPAADPGNWALRVVGSGAAIVDELQIPANSLGSFFVDHQPTWQGRLESDLKLEGRQLVGSVTNRMSASLNDALLVLDYEVLRLGDLKPGDSREVNHALAPGAKAGFGAPQSFSNQLYPVPGGPRRQTDPARRDILDSVFGSGFSFARMELAGPTIIGWVDAPAVGIEPNGIRAVELDTTLMFNAVNISIPRGFEGEIPASIVGRKPLGVATLNRQQFGTYDLSPGESVSLQFSLPVSAQKFLLDGLYINMDGRLRGPSSANTASVGDVSIYNWRLGEWEERSVSFGRNLVRDVHSFVSASGDVRLRFTFRPPPDSGVSGVMFSRLDVTASGLMR